MDFIIVEPEISTNDSKVIQAHEHETVALSCTADGVPRPTSIFWFRNATLIDPALFKKINVTKFEVVGFREKGYQGIKSTLRIRDVNPRSDSGLYSCRSSNGIGQPAILENPLELRIAKGNV